MSLDPTTPTPAPASTSAIDPATVRRAFGLPNPAPAPTPAPVAPTPKPSSTPAVIVRPNTPLQRLLHSRRPSNPALDPDPSILLPPRPGSTYTGDPLTVQREAELNRLPGSDVVLEAEAIERARRSGSGHRHSESFLSEEFGHTGGLPLGVGGSSYGHPKYSAHGSGNNDLPYTDWLLALERSKSLALSHPFASRGMQIRSDLVSAGGMRPVATCPDPEKNRLVQDALDAHWGSNDWPLDLNRRIWDAQVQGEQVRLIRPDHGLVVALNGRAYGERGRFEAGDVGPEEVRDVIPDPFNRRRPLQLVLEPNPYRDELYAANRVRERGINGKLNPKSDSSLYDGAGRPIFAGQVVDVVRRLRSGPDFGRIVGQAFFLPLNNVLGMQRGLSDLFPVHEWIDLHQTVEYVSAERAQLLLSFVYQIVREGATPEQIMARAKQIAREGIAPGSAWLSDGSEVISAISPQLAAGETNVLLDSLFAMIWGGLGLPEHWFFTGGNTNRATADRMGDPLFLWAQGRRATFEGHFALECELALQRARENGSLRPEVTQARYGVVVEPSDMTFIFKSVDPDVKRFELIGSVVSSWADGMAKALVTEQVPGGAKTAKFMMTRLLEQTGLDMPDLSEEVGGGGGGDAFGGEGMAGEEGGDETRSDETGTEFVDRVRREALEYVDRRQAEASDDPISNPLTHPRKVGVTAWHWQAGVGLRPTVTATV